MRKNEPVIKAERGGFKRGFYQSHWDAMPANKYGWKEIKAELPKAVSEAMQPKPQAAQAEPAKEPETPATPKRRKRKK